MLPLPYSPGSAIPLEKHHVQGMDIYSPLLWTLVPACQEAGEGPDQCCPSTAVLSPCSQLLVLSPATSGPPVALGKARYWAFLIAK